MLEDDDGSAQAVSAEALALLFELFENIECIVLNACYSTDQAEVLRNHADYIIGMGADIDDRSALEFAVGFYGALGVGRDYVDAFKFGKAAIDLALK